MLWQNSLLETSREEGEREEGPSQGDGIYMHDCDCSVRLDNRRHPATDSAPPRGLGRGGGVLGTEVGPGFRTRHHDSRLMSICVICGKCTLYSRDSMGGCYCTNDVY